VRVAVRHADESHPNGQWFAFGEGRIVGFTHPITGESWTPEHVAAALLGRAKEQFPEEDGYEHRIETLHVVEVDEDGNEVGAWFPIGESDLPRPGQGATLEQALAAAQDQEGAAE
jgi:hypothetical protein